MRPAPCNLRAAVCGILCRIPQHRPQHVNCSAQAAWFFMCAYEQTRSTHGRPVCRARGGASAPRFCEANVKSLILTIGAPPPDLYFALPVLFNALPVFKVTGRPWQHASEIAENSVALLVEIQRKLKYVQLGAACGLRPAAKYI